MLHSINQNKKNINKNMIDLFNQKALIIKLIAYM